MQETARYVSATHSNAPTEFHASIQTRLISPSSGTVEFAPENSDFTSGNSDSLPVDSEWADFLCVKSGKWAESPAETSASKSRRLSSRILIVLPGALVSRIFSSRVARRIVGHWK